MTLIKRHPHLLLEGLSSPCYSASLTSSILIAIRPHPDHTAPSRIPSKAIEEKGGAAPEALPKRKAGLLGFVASAAAVLKVWIDS